jgi:hypothetical protein
MNIKLIVIFAMVVLFLTSVPAGIFLYAPGLRQCTGKQIKIIEACWLVIILLAATANYFGQRFLLDGEAPRADVYFMPCYCIVMLGVAVITARGRKRQGS